MFIDQKLLISFSFKFSLCTLVNKSSNFSTGSGGSGRLIKKISNTIWNIHNALTFVIGAAILSITWLVAIEVLTTVHSLQIIIISEYFYLRSIAAMNKKNSKYQIELSFIHVLFDSIFICVVYFSNLESVPAHFTYWRPPSPFPKWFYTYLNILYLT